MSTSIGRKGASGWQARSAISSRALAGVPAPFLSGGARSARTGAEATLQLMRFALIMA